MPHQGPIGVFDSGYGGLTILKDFVHRLPDYDFLYLGDNARSPYGTRSFETVYQYTLQCVKWFFDKGCPLVILACNTASAKALRTIQQNDLPDIAPSNRVLGVIRPTAEIIGQFSKTGKVGVLATKGTVNSLSYVIEIEKFFPETEVFQEACPMWVPLIENNEHLSAGAAFFIKQNIDNLLAKEKNIDTILLGCTHYPLVKAQIASCLPSGIKIISQGEIVAKSLENYIKNHPEIDERCTKTAARTFYTTDSPEDFDNHASHFYGALVQSKHLDIVKI